jgi:tRNA uridine 5-carbamoylmethylation protein Kti12
MRVVILSGLPGSGKSTYARTLVDETGGRWVVCSADLFFMVNGEYLFDPSKIGEAHQKCWQHFYDAMSLKIENIIVDNTNLTTWEISPYVLPAEAQGYTVEIKTMVCDWQTAAKRNIHGVPQKTIERMAETLVDRKLPPWWKHEYVGAPEWMRPEFRNNPHMWISNMERTCR